MTWRCLPVIEDILEYLNYMNYRLEKKSCVNLCIYLHDLCESIRKESGTLKVMQRLIKNVK